MCFKTKLRERQLGMHAKEREGFYLLKASGGIRDKLPLFNLSKKPHPIKTKFAYILD